LPTLDNLFEGEGEGSAGVLFLTPGRFGQGIEPKRSEFLLYFSLKVGPEEWAQAHFFIGCGFIGCDPVWN
jgi:hypothetical protein